MLGALGLTPRFDNAWHTVLNLVGIALWLAVVILVIARDRRTRRMSGWDWLAILLHISIVGVYVPLGPLVWLGHHAVARHETPV